MNNFEEIKQKELENCSFVKTILMMLVVFYHSIKFWSGDWFTAIQCNEKIAVFSTVAAWLNSFHIYSFTLCSGYIYSYLKNEKGRYTNYPNYIKNKATRLLVPYIFASIFWVIPITEYFYHFDVLILVKRYLFAINPSQLWFLWMLFDVFLVVHPMNEIIKNDLYATVICVLSIIIGIVGGKILPNVFCIWTAFAYLPFFILGFKIRQKKEWFIRKIPLLVYLFIDLALFIVWRIVLKHSGIVAFLGKTIIEFLLHAIGSLMAFFVLQKIAGFLGEWEKKRMFEMFTKYSMPIYLFHQQIIFIILWLGYSRFNPFILVAINFMAAMGISVFISMVLMKFKTTRFLIGEK